jgi:hypothetical protein
MVMPVGTAFPVKDVAFPNTVFHGRKLGLSWISDGDVPYFTPFLKNSQPN